MSVSRRDTPGILTPEYLFGSNTRLTHLSYSPTLSFFHLFFFFNLTLISVPQRRDKGRDEGRLHALK